MIEITVYSLERISAIKIKEFTRIEKHKRPTFGVKIKAAF